jgi:hypothetical protein
MGGAREKEHRREGETGMRGFLGGVSVGALVAVAGAAVWSLSTPLPQAVDVSQELPVTTLQPREVPMPPSDVPGSDADLVEAAPAEPDADALGRDSAPDEIDTSLPERPSVSTDPEVTLDGAPVESDTPRIAVTSDADAPVSGGDDSTRPEAPSQDTTPDLGADSATRPEVSAASDLPLQAPDAEIPTPDLSTEADAAPLRQETLQVEAPDIGTPPDVTTSPVLTTPPVRSLTPSDPVEDDAGANGGVRIADLPQASEDPETNAGPSIGTRVLPLTERDTTGADASSAADRTAAPFVRNSEPANPEPGLPLMSIVLVEEEGAVGAEALEDFPYPLTFAIDPSDPDAVARMQARRAAGFEVMVLADLPREGQPQDAETAMPVWFDRLPEAVGILEGIDSGVQGNRALADQVASIAGDLGYGLVLQDNGLNTVQKMALRDGIPSGVVFRDFDGAGQDPRAMRRFLDQAAFRSGQEGAVIMLGRLKPDTISALLIWGLQDRASSVALVPISTSLKRLLEPVSN